MTNGESSVRAGVARSAAVLAMVSTLAIIALWSIAAMAVQTAFSQWLFNDHLPLAIGLTITGGAVSGGLALMALTEPSTPPRSRTQARFALRCLGVAVLVSAGMLLLVSGQGA